MQRVQPQGQLHQKHGSSVRMRVRGCVCACVRARDAPVSRKPYAPSYSNALTHCSVSAVLASRSWLGITLCAIVGVTYACKLHGPRSWSSTPANGQTYA
eukprot:3133687-Amphidinium_carterae.1